MKKYYEQIVEGLECFFESSTQNFTSYLQNKQKKYKYTCIWGVGNLGRPTAVEFLRRNLKVDFYCDNDQRKWGKNYDGIMCITPNELCEIKDETWVIICARSFKDIYKQLCKLGFPNLDRVYMNKFSIRDYLEKCEKKEFLRNIQMVLDICADDTSREVFSRIILEWINNESGNLEDVCSNNQYFCDDILCLTQDEIFVDGGAYNGDTLQEFLKIKGENFKKIILFELSQKNFMDLEKNVSMLPLNIRNKIVLYNKGISDKNTEIWYEELDEGSSEEKEGTTKGYLGTIDEICKDEGITYIKMDIEGSEMAALRGAQSCILQNKPKLAICLYHKPADLWEIPIYIKRILPEYKIYIRHHTNLLNETVCYAVV